METHVEVWSKRRTPDLKEYIRTRAELIIGRFATRLDHVDIHLCDENGCKGGVDQVCTIDLKLMPRGVVHVSAKDENVKVAVVRALHRAEKSIAKLVDCGHRSHEIRRRRGGIRNLGRELETIDETVFDRTT